MPQPVSPPITSTPSQPGQPYDADGPTYGPWVKLEANAGPADIHDGHVTGSFPDSGVWDQV